MSEEWRPIIGFSAGSYEVSSVGRVHNIKSGRILRTRLSNHAWPYVAVGLLDNGVPKARYVHRLVAEAFVAGKTEELCEVNHKDCNKLNNQVSNLEWVSSKENHAHATRSGLKVCGEKHGRSCLTEKQVLEIRDRYSRGETYMEDLALDYETTRSTIWRIVTRKSWTHITREEKEDVRSNPCIEGEVDH